MLYDINSSLFIHVYIVHKSLRSICFNVNLYPPGDFWMKTYVLIYFYKAQGARCHITEKEIMFVKYFIKLRRVIRIKFSQYLNTET